MHLGAVERGASVTAQPFWRKILIGVQLCHSSGCFLFVQCLVDLLTIRIHIKPGIQQIGRTERREIGKNPLVIPAQTSVGLERPDRDACANDTGVTALYAGRFLYPRPGVNKVKR